MQYAGRDATPGFEPVHPIDILKILPPAACIGQLDPKDALSLQGDSSAAAQSQSPNAIVNVQSDGKQGEIKPFSKPPISRMLNIFDFEAVARMVMKKEGIDAVRIE
jgi:hypothetical protein